MELQAEIGDSVKTAAKTNKAKRGTAMPTSMIKRNGLQKSKYRTCMASLNVRVAV